MTRFGIDTQKMFNFWTSYIAEVVAYAPKNRYIHAAGQIEKYAEYWGNMNKQAVASLPYDLVTKDGHLAPPPQIVPYPEVPMAAVEGRRECIEDMKAIYGIYNPSLGNVEASRSGRAILAEKVQSNLANYNFTDNLRIGITHTARIINDWMNIYYPPGTVARILGDEPDSEDSFVVGAPDTDTKELEPMSLGDPDVDVVVTMGISHDTKRQQAVEAIMDLVRAVPNITPMISDIFVGNMDFSGANAIAKRLKKLVPPEMLEEKGGEMKLQKQIQMLMKQVGQDKMVIEQLSQRLQEAMRKLETKDIESATKIKVAKINAEADIAVANIRAVEDKNKEANKMSRLWFSVINQNSKQPAGVE
jgi:hypothetical protein